MSYTTLQLIFFSFELIYCFKMCFEIFFAECKKKHSAKASLPSARKTTLGKPPGTRQRAGLRQCILYWESRSWNHLPCQQHNVTGFRQCCHAYNLVKDHLHDHPVATIHSGQLHGTIPKNILQLRTLHSSFQQRARTQFVLGECLDTLYGQTIPFFNLLALLCILSEQCYVDNDACLSASSIQQWRNRCFGLRLQYFNGLWT